MPVHLPHGGFGYGAQADLDTLKYSIPSKAQYALGPGERGDLPITTSTRQWRRHQWIAVGINAEGHATVGTVPFRAAGRDIRFSHVDAWHMEPFLVALNYVSMNIPVPLGRRTLLSQEIMSP
jgi:hypothetical protein